MFRFKYSVWSCFNEITGFTFVGNFSWTERNQVCFDINKQELSDASECSDASASRNLIFGGSGSIPTYPRGCYYRPNTPYVYWNTDANGNRSDTAISICKDLGGYSLIYPLILHSSIILTCKNILLKKELLNSRSIVHGHIFIKSLHSCRW